MIERITLENYRGFRLHEIPLHPTSILVGENNAGKSTIIEALRLVSLVTARYANLGFADRPRWVPLPRRIRGVRPSLRGLELNEISLFYNLGEPPASISCTFSSGSTLTLFVGPDSELFAAIRDPHGDEVRSRADASLAPLPTVAILPQIGPLSPTETILDSEYVRRVDTTSLASRHFRNHLRIYADQFEQFRLLAEQTWPGLRVRPLEGASSFPGEQLALLVQDGSFVAEVAWVGHGLQMWLQTMWFLARFQGADTIILDEPDVYMHADLQRKLIRLLRGRHPQTIVATHSTEIIAEVEPDDIVLIDRKARRSRFAGTLPVLQNALAQMGTIHNLHLTRLWKSKRLLLVEGKDVRLLRAIQDAVFPNSPAPLDTVPSLEIGGWGGWAYAVGSRMVLTNAAGEQITTYCILDSDFHTEEEKQERLKAARDLGISLHIWRWKEIENYFVVASAIHRLIAHGCPTGTVPPSLEDVVSRIDYIFSAERDKTTDAIATEIFAKNRAAGVTQANRRARAIVGGHWTSEDGPISLVSGKRLISSLSRWSQRAYGVSMSPRKIASFLLKEELHPEVVSVVRAIERGAPFPSSRTGSA